MTSLIKIKINSPNLGFEQGSDIEIVCDDNGLPLNHFWRKRFKDAQLDNCITVIERSNQKVIMLESTSVEVFEDKEAIEIPVKSSKKSDKK